MNINTLFEYADALRDMLDIKAVAEIYGLDFNRNGFTCCPFHAEKTASFKVQNRRYAHCFGCGWNGDAIKFTREMFGLSFTDAIVKLNGDFSCGLPLDRKPTLREQRELQRKHAARLTQQRAEQDRRNAWEAEYWRRWDEFMRLDRNVREYKPNTPDEPLHPLFVEALHNIKYAKYLMEELPELQDYKTESGDA